MKNLSSEEERIESIKNILHRMEELSLKKSPHQQKKAIPSIKKEITLFDGRVNTITLRIPRTF